jgi:ABC-type uncharacterized transport system involved in gliding motility auxiliary subunit
MLPWTSSIEVKDTSSAEAIILVRSSKNSWLMKGVFNLSPQGIRTPKRKDMKSYPLVVVMNGKFKSYFKNHELPEELAGSPVVEESPETQIAVIGNSRFLSDPFAQSYQENVTFFLNLLDWMTFGEELISIRSKGVTDRPLKSLSPAMRTLYKNINTFGMAVLVVIFGLVRYGIQRRKRRARNL